MNYSNTISGFINQQHRSDSVNYEISDKHPMGCDVSKPAFRICGKVRCRAAALPRSLISAFFFPCLGSTMSDVLIRYFKPLAIFRGFTCCFGSDLVGNPEDSFSHTWAPIMTAACFILVKMSSVTRKPSFEVADEVRLKPAWSATDSVQSLENLGL